jgi:hypothetical protein
MKRMAGRIMPALIVFFLSGCGEKKKNAVENEDPYMSGLPRFVNVNFIEPDRMERISRFRSAAGPDYSDDFEHCRSMKHRFQPKDVFDWSTLPIYAPVHGPVLRVSEGRDGSEIWIQSHEYTDIEIGLFHVVLSNDLNVGQPLYAGQVLGTVAGRQALPEIAVGVRSPSGWRLVSYFDVISDSAQNGFRKCFNYMPQNFIITREQRDADPLVCSGDSLAGSGLIGDWTIMDCRYDVDAWGIPKFVRHNYIDLDRIARISKFRSSVGHDYSDDFEHCRSMKHYFMPDGSGDWSQVRVFAPVDGTVALFFDEWIGGTQIWLTSSEYPDFEFDIFHIHLQDSLHVGQFLTAGQLLGTHIGSQTYSDIAVCALTPNGRKRVSYFDVMTDSLFQDYQARGAQSRGDFIISRELRDLNPLTCQGEAFTSESGNLENWFDLN